MTVPRYAREIPQRYRLEAGRCKQCGQTSFPPRMVCTGCRGQEVEVEQLPRQGRLVTWTVIHTPPDAFALQAPYVLAIVELKEDVRVTAQLTDCDPDALHVGCPVEYTFRRIQADGPGGILMYGYKFRPVSAPVPA